GPGDSIGIGLAGLLSGAEYYIGLDLLPFSARTDLERIFDEIVRMYMRKEPIPDNNEFPRMRPQLRSYEFQDYAIEWAGFSERVEGIGSDIRAGWEPGQLVGCQARWTSIAEIAQNSFDFIFSKAVFEYVAPADETYNAMSIWVKAGGYASHVIDLSAHYL